MIDITREYLNDRYGYITNYLKQDSFLSDVDVSSVIDRLLYLSSELLEDGTRMVSRKRDKHLRINNIIKLSSEILNSIDPSLCDLFKQSLIDGSFIMYPEGKEEKLRKKFLSKRDYFKAQCFEKEGCHVCCASSSDLIVKCPISGTVGDVVSIVHEMIHFAARKEAFKKDPYLFNQKHSLLTEVPSIYFEKYAMDYLVSIGFDKDSLYSQYLERFNENLMATTFYIAEFDFLNVFNRDKEVNRNNLLEDERFPVLLDNMIKIGNSDKSRDKELSYVYDISKVLQSKDKDAWCDWWISTTDIVRNSEHLSYILGRCYASVLPQDKDTLREMYDISKCVYFPSKVVSDNVLFSRVESCINKKYKSKVKM